MKRTTTLLVLLAAVLTAGAQTISRQQAMERAARFLQSAPAANASRKAVKEQPQLTAADIDMAHLYAFNLKGGGFVIASGDERALPVLGYSTSGTIDDATMPANMRAWLDGYSRAIAALGNAAFTAAAKEPAQRAAVQPLLKTTWDQEVVYNLQCPTYIGDVDKFLGEPTLTGCTATAMAQIMNYWQWPQEATTQVPAYTYVVENLAKGVEEKFSLDALPATTFDWTNMANSYMNGTQVLPGITDQQKQAVAKLMRYCGQSLHMRYSPYISLALSGDAVLALRQYFNYDQGVRLVDRQQYTIDEWDALIYNELAQGRPVLYSGQSDQGGHSFVCDGYDGQGLYHFNWGWQGSKDNYFALSVLDPNQANASGIAQPGIGFVVNQNAVIGIQKPVQGSVADSDNPMLEATSNYYVNEASLFGTLYGYQVGVNAALFAAAYAMNRTYEVGLFVQNADGSWGEAIKSHVLANDWPAGQIRVLTFDLDVNDSGADRTERLYIRVRMKGADGNWGSWYLIGRQDMYFSRTVKSGKVTVTYMPAPNFAITNCAVTHGTGGVNQPNDLTLTVLNRGSEYQGTLLLRPYLIGSDTPDVAYQNLLNNSGDYVTYKDGVELPQAGAFLKAGVTGEVTFSFSPWAEGNYLLVLFEDNYPNTALAYTSISIPATPAAIGAVSDDAGTTAAPLFDLQGRRISGTPARRGIYVRGGKKIAY